MSTYVLVHGSWHGAWCWHRVTPLLRGLGHGVLTPDLPGHGGDVSPVGALSLGDYAERIGDAVKTAAEPVVLVGHSMGGMVISQVAENHPARIRALVYLTALLPLDGQSLNQLAQNDAASLLPANCFVTDDGNTLALKDEALRDALYADCPDEDVALARRMIRPEPLAPLFEPVCLSATRADRVPRYYIECLADRALSLACQRRMQAARPCRGVVSLPSSHSPFFSMPQALVEYLHRGDVMATT